MRLVHTLLHPPPCQPTRFVRFVPGSPYLVAATSDQVYVWNLLTAKVWWSARLRVVSTPPLATGFPERRNDTSKSEG